MAPESKPNPTRWKTRAIESTEPKSCARNGADSFTRLLAISISTRNVVERLKHPKKVHEVTVPIERDDDGTVEVLRVIEPNHYSVKEALIRGGHRYHPEARGTGVCRTWDVDDLKCTVWTTVRRCERQVAVNPKELSSGEKRNVTVVGLPRKFAMLSDRIAIFPRPIWVPIRLTWRG